MTAKDFELESESKAPKASRAKEEEKKWHTGTNYNYPSRRNYEPQKERLGEMHDSLRELQREDNQKKEVNFLLGGLATQVNRVSQR